MRLDSRFKIEETASKDAARPHLFSPHLDVEGKRLMACNGYALAIVPCEVEEGDQAGLVPAAACRAARGAKHVKAQAEQVVCDGATYARPQDEFPSVEHALPGFKEGDDGTVTVGLTTDYLIALVKALGAAGRGGQIALTIKVPEKGKPVLDQVLVRPMVMADGPVIGVLMPVRP
jgi:hypothetical protein